MQATKRRGVWSTLYLYQFIFPVNVIPYERELSDSLTPISGRELVYKLPFLHGSEKVFMLSVCVLDEASSICVYKHLREGHIVKSIPATV